MKQVDPDVFGAFPITPSTDIPECFSQYVADGTVHTEFVTVESEHSSMSVCLAAEAAGARSVCATSSCGLALMYEMLYVTASSRQPVTLVCVNRALSGPININNDHSDSMKHHLFNSIRCIRRIIPDRRQILNLDGIR